MFERIKKIQGKNAEGADFDAEKSEGAVGKPVSHFVRISANAGIARVEKFLMDGDPIVPKGFGRLGRLSVIHQGFRFFHSA